MNEENQYWSNSISRIHPLYVQKNDIRSPFYRDYTRIIHCRGYRRLKNKTQVFYATDNDHICTRIEHVQHVEAISNIICKHIGLNTELARAISLGHDIGHSPFGHAGEEILKDLSSKNCNHFTFWHEKNGLRFVDFFETLSDPKGQKTTLDLTYAVRDGIICHCGEVNDKCLVPRKEFIELQNIETPGKTIPYTWEGCVVRISDKISYIGRDIEDAIALGILSSSQINSLQEIYEEATIKAKSRNRISNTVLIHELIMDLCSNSSPEKGLGFSRPYFQLLKNLRSFSKTTIYEHPRLKVFKNYARLMITSIFEYLLSSKEEIVSNLPQWKKSSSSPILAEYFSGWLTQYSDISYSSMDLNSVSKCIYKLDTDYSVAIIEFISGMTDHFIMKVFEEMTRF